jgi:hypothetical protein
MKKNICIFNLIWIQNVNIYLDYAGKPDAEEQK